MQRGTTSISRRRTAALSAATVAAAGGLIVAVVWPASAAVAPAANGTYTLASGASGKCLTVSSTLLVQVACGSGLTTQQFKVTGSTLVNVGNSQCITSPDTTAGTQLSTAACSTATSQNWTFTASTAASGKYLVKNSSSGLCLTDKDASTAGNNPIVQQTCSDVSQTQWSFTEISPGSTPTTSPTTSAPAGKAVAFPGATGPAMNATGGRGGDVYHVTNLTDNANSPAAGSLRYGLNNAPSSGRTIVFDVAGTIKLSPAGRAGWLSFGKSNLTLAGQTAPKPGITIMGQATKVTGDNVIIRHLKFRPGKDQALPETATNDGLWLTGNNIIVDHVSVSWADDESISASDGAGQITVQYSLAAEALNYKGHSYGALVGSDVTGSNIAYTHNLFAHHVARLPRLGNETGAVNNVEWSNNVIYEGYGYSGDDQLANGNIVNNVWLRQSTSPSYIFKGATGTAIYQAGNKWDTDGDSNLTNGADATWTQFIDVPTHKTSRFNVPNVTYEAAYTALPKVLDTAGAFYWSRDAIDTRIVSETRSTSGAVIDNYNTSQWNALWNASSTSRASSWDTDDDGMPDTWETANGLNPGVDDHNGDADNDGYRNIEEYLDAAARGK